MDSFNDILKLASANQGVAERELVYKKGINTSVGKAKKEPKDRPKGVKSAAVQAFLKKKEIEEKKKAVEDQKKKEALMKLREEKNTVGKMNNIIKRNHTKEAIFQVEGKEERNAADTPVLAPVKSDDNKITEYTKLKSQVTGKERKAALQNVKRLKVSAHWVPKEEREGAAAPDDSKSSNHSKDSKKSGSSESLTNNTDLKVKHTKNGYTDKQPEVKEDKAKEIKKKKRPPAPPPINFNDLLKLAEQKKSGVVTEPPKKVPNKSDKDSSKRKEPKLPDRPMTQDEKERWLRVHSKEYQAWIKHGKARPDFCVSERKKKRRSGGNNSGLNIKSAANVAVSDSDDDGDLSDNNHVDRTPVKESSKQYNSSSSKPTSAGSNNKNSNQYNSSSSKPTSAGSNSKNSNQYNSSSSKPTSAGSNSKNGIKPQSKVGVNNSSNGKQSAVSKSLNLKPSKDLISDSRKSDKNGVAGVKQSKNSQNQKRLQSSSSTSSSQPSSSKQSNSKSAQMCSKTGNKMKNSTTKYDEVRENVLVCGNRGPKEKKKPEPQMSTWDRIYGDIQKKKKPKPEMKKRRVIESDSEVDSEMDDFIEEDEDEYDEMDDFIDDSQAMDYSQHIRAIFGYDKNKYRDEDDDISDMEAGFADVEREEQISEAIGMQEDLEDMKMEEAHKKRKMAMKKKMAKKMRR